MPKCLWCGDLFVGQHFNWLCTKLYRQGVAIPMGTNCAPLVAHLFLFCYERDFMMSLSDDMQADVFDALNTTSRYLDKMLNNNVYFDNMVSQIYPSELQLNKANTSDTKATFLDLHLSISNYIVLFVCFCALRPKSTAMVIAGRSVHLTTLFPGQAWTSG